MPSTQHHTIRRQSLAVEVTGGEDGGFALQRALSELCAERLAPALAAAFDRLVPPDEHWTVDVLDVDVGSVAWARLAEDLAAMVVPAVEAALRSRLSGIESGARLDGVLRRTDAQAMRAAFLFYLRTGLLPWWFQLPPGGSFDLDLLSRGNGGGPRDVEEERFVSELIAGLRRPAVRERLWQLSSITALNAFLTVRWPRLVRLAVDILAILDNADLPAELHRVAASRVWIAVLAHLGTSDVTPDRLAADAFREFATPSGNAVLREVMTRHWPNLFDRADRTGAGMAAPSGRRRGSGVIPAAEEDAALVPAAEGLHIDCAGTVLLHPFLPRLFDALGIAAGDELLSPARALSLLHFLATGQRRAPEHELVLYKVLCDLPIAAAVDTTHEVNEHEEEEAVALLEAVIRHWEALGDTSIEALRGTFLVRPGRLSQRGDGDWQLQVETRAFDILLGGLPWGLGAIRLPWMDSFLWVDWPS